MNLSIMMRGPPDSEGVRRWKEYDGMEITSMRFEFEEDNVLLYLEESE